MRLGPLRGCILPQHLQKIQNAEVKKVKICNPGKEEDNKNISQRMIAKKLKELCKSCNLPTSRVKVLLIDHMSQEIDALEPASVVHASISNKDKVTNNFF